MDFSKMSDIDIAETLDMQIHGERDEKIMENIIYEMQKRKSSQFSEVLREVLLVPSPGLQAEALHALADIQKEGALDVLMKYSCYDAFCFFCINEIDEITHKNPPKNVRDFFFTCLNSFDYEDVMAALTFFRRYPSQEADEAVFFNTYKNACIYTLALEYIKERDDLSMAFAIITKKDINSFRSLRNNLKRIVLPHLIAHYISREEDIPVSLKEAVFLFENTDSLKKLVSDAVKGRTCTLSRKQKNAISRIVFSLDKMKSLKKPKMDNVLPFKKKKKTA
ncbi:hypothetical protein KAW38_01595 [Candidatus Micrarchaeota archaeon]|nr:hypothetical protein [Candidatus Micrarchaeota archaeon]